jgi:glycosyltransferase involved in cell wall biosynthesis
VILKECGVLEALMSHSPLVSIITPVFNGSRFIEELISSVHDQDYSHIEHIVIDDGSNDNGATVNILKRYTHLRWWSRPNKGAYATINEGIAAAKGELVTIICSDDKYASRTSISAAVNKFNKYNECDVIYGETITIGEDGLVLDEEQPRTGPLWIFRYYAVLTHCSMLVKRTRIVEADLWFDESFPYIADYDWIMRMFRAGFIFKRLRQPIAMFRQHASQRSVDVSPARVEEFEQLWQKYGKRNRFVLSLVQKWVALTKLRNLLYRRGISGFIRTIKLRLS